MKPIRPDRVAIYVRWSTDDQTEGTTLQVQLEGCRHYALSQGWVPQEELTFIDDGFSGASLHRPGLSRLRALIRQGEIDCVVVLKTDRLSRNIVDAVELVLNEWTDSCHFKSAREPIDTGTDLGRVIFGVLAMFADFERSQIRERTQAGKMRRIAQGEQLHGRPPFGYCPSDKKGQWLENPLEADLLRRIFQMAAGGQTAAAICRKLNDEGQRTRAGKLWSIRALLWILRNRLYIGEAIYGRTQLKRHPHPNGGAATMRVIRDEPAIAAATRAAPPLVKPELFAQAFTQLARCGAARRQFGARSLNGEHLLAGLALCRCGAKLVVKRQGERISYVCRQTRSGGCPEAAGYIRGAVADTAVMEHFLARFGPAAAMPKRLRQAAERLRTVQRSAVAQLSSARQELSALRLREERVLRAAASGQIALTDLQDLRGSIARDRAAVQQRIESLRQGVPEGEPGRCPSPPCGSVTGSDGTIGGMDWAAWATCLSVQQWRELLRLALATPLVLFKGRGDVLTLVEMQWASAPFASACSDPAPPWSPEPTETLLHALEQPVCLKVSDEPVPGYDPEVLLNRLAEILLGAGVDQSSAQPVQGK